jgi:hypothetical protein
MPAPADRRSRPRWKGGEAKGAVLASRPLHDRVERLFYRLKAQAGLRACGLLYDSVLGARVGHRKPDDGAGRALSSQRVT